jgi:hypothetical protein
MKAREKYTVAENSAVFEKSLRILAIAPSYCS